MGNRELVALLNLSSWCLAMVERLFLAVPQGCLQFVIVVFPDHTQLLFLLSLFMINFRGKTDPSENQQYKKTTELVLLSLFMITFRMCNDSHFP